MSRSPTGALYRDLWWSASGTLLPALAALWAVPRYTAALGTDGFGVLALVWSLVGWFSVADLGLSRAITQGVARALAQRDPLGASSLSWSALAVMLPLALVVGGAVAASAPWLAGRLRLAGPLAVDTVHALRWVGVAVPLTVAVTALRGVGEGARAFRALALLRAPTGVAFALVPLWLLRHDPRLVVAVQGIVAVRAVAVVAHAGLAVAVLPSLRVPSVVGAREWRALLAFGGFTTVVNTLGPLLNMLDRLMLGVLAPVALLAPYGVASEAGTRVWLLAAVVLPVQYAWYAATLATARGEAVRAYLRGLGLLAAAGFPVLLVVVLLGERVMRWWVGEALGPNAAALLAVMALGLMANLVAQGAQAFVEAAGRPVYTAVGYLWQLPLTLLAFGLVVPRAGAMGAAWVWSARFVVDALWCAWAAEQAVPEARAVRARVLTLLMLPPALLAGALLWRAATAG